MRHVVTLFRGATQHTHNSGGVETTLQRQNHTVLYCAVLTRNTVCKGCAYRYGCGKWRNYDLMSVGEGGIGMSQHWTGKVRVKWNE